MVNRAIQFDSSQLAATPYYPSDGNGGFTAVPDDSFVRNAEVSIITEMFCPHSASNAQQIEVYHEGGALAFKTYFNNAAIGPQEFKFKDGLRLVGNWYVSFPSVGSATDFWHIEFKTELG